MATKSHASREGTRRYLLIGGYGLLVATFLLVGVLPTMRSVKAAKADIVKYQQDIDTRQQQKQQLEGIRKSIDLINFQTRDYERLVPSDADLGPFLRDLYKHLAESKMTDVSVRNLPSTPLGRSQKLPIEIRGKGTFAAFDTFLKRLEKLDRLSSVGKLLIDADTEMSGNVDVQLTLFIYSAKSVP